MIKIAFAGCAQMDCVMQKLRYNILSNEVIVSYVFLFEPLCFSVIDSIYIQHINLIQNYIDEFDYIIIANSEEYDKYYFFLSQYIDSKRIINSQVILNYTGFDFIRYIKIIESDISIISDSCWGGFVYNSLNLKFNSPLINTSVAPDDFLELISNVKYYLSCPLEKYAERDCFNPPIGILGNKVKVGLNHYTDFSSGVDAWNRRVKRINYDNLLIQMANFKNINDVERFDNILIDNKIGFYPEKTNFTSIVYLKQYSENSDVRIRTGEFIAYIQNIVQAQSLFFRPINMFKLLLHEKDFMRID